MTGTSTPCLLRRVVLIAALALPFAACGPGSSVYVGVAAPGPWVGYPGGYYPGAWGYPGYRWEEEDEEQPDVPDPLDWEAPWAQSSTSPQVDESTRPSR